MFISCNISMVTKLPTFVTKSTQELRRLMGGKNIILSLEGGYDNGAIRACALQCARALLGYPLDEPRWVSWESVKLCPLDIVFKSLFQAGQEWASVWHGTLWRQNPRIPEASFLWGKKYTIEYNLAWICDWHYIRDFTHMHLIIHRRRPRPRPSILSWACWISTKTTLPVSGNYMMIWPSEKSMAFLQTDLSKVKICSNLLIDITCARNCV